LNRTCIWCLNVFGRAHFGSHSDRGCFWARLLAPFHACLVPTLATCHSNHGQYYSGNRRADGGRY
jgi:hypothetical protein